MAELGGPRRAPVDGRFRIGSVTKVMTATVVLQLVAEGRLKLDDPLSAHLPNVVEEAGTVTIKHLLGHTSGVPEHTGEVIDENGMLKEWTARRAT